MFEFCSETQECRRTWRQTSQVQASSLPTSGSERLAQLSQEVCGGCRWTWTQSIMIICSPGDTTPPTPRPTDGPTKPTNPGTTSHGPGPTNPTQVLCNCDNACDDVDNLMSKKCTHHPHPIIFISSMTS